MREINNKYFFLARACFAITYGRINYKGIIYINHSGAAFSSSKLRKQKSYAYTVRFVSRKLKFAVLPQQILLGNCGHAKWSLLFMVVQPQDNFL
jgi:hypothetical protein